MNANELMIGDWVRYKVTPYLITSGEEIDKLHSEFTPLTLNTKLLELNGYKFNGLFYTNSDKKYPDIYKSKYSEFFELGKLTYSVHGDLELPSIVSCRYIHEFQHALKFCSIHTFKLS